MKEKRSVDKLAWHIIAVSVAALFLAFPASSLLALTEAEIIQSGLPPKITPQSAPKRDFLFAVCKAVSRYRSSAPEIVHSAIETRPEFSNDIVTTAIGCLREPKEGILDCELGRRILLEGSSANPAAAYEITELMISLLPDCQLDVPAEGPSNVPVNINPHGPPLPRGVPGNCVVCHNGHEIHVLCETIDNFLSSHPGDRRGSCQSTPITNP